MPPALRRGMRLRDTGEDDATRASISLPGVLVQNAPASRQVRRMTRARLSERNDLDPVRLADRGRDSENPVDHRLPVETIREIVPETLVVLGEAGDRRDDVGGTPQDRST